MIFQIVFLLFGTLQAITCHPQLQTIRIPELNVSPPQQVNSLEGDDIKIINGRSITENNQNNNIEDTIKEVEDIIKSNPELPRLTRGEILDILENITVNDNINDKIKKHPNNNNIKRDPKAIMVVMPYTPSNDDNKNIEDLYTKPPVTQILNAEPFRITTTTTTNKRRKNSNTLTSDQKPEATVTTSSTTEVPSTVRHPQRRRRPQFSLTTTTTTAATPFTVDTTTTRSRSRRPSRRRTTVTTTKHPNHRYPEEDQENENKEVTKKITLRTQKPLRRRPTPSTTTTTTTSTFSPHGIKIIDSPDLATDEDNTREVILKQMFPVAVATTTTTTTSKPLIEEIDLPIPLKAVADDLNLEEALKPQKSNLPTYFTPKDYELELSKTITTTTTLIPDVSNVADALSPEMRELLKKFGLLPDPNEKLQKTAPPPAKFYPEKAEITSDSYIGFKPLPESGPSRNEMEALLASFGLGRNSRKDKSIKQINDENNFDIVPEHLRSVLTDLGLERQEKKINYSTTKQHIFNPDSTNYATEEELEKLTKLLDMVKQLSKLNRTATEDDFKKVDMDNLKELLNTFNNYNKNNNGIISLDKLNGPDPNEFNNGLIKNEIKRQTSTTEQPKNPSLKDLEESFGGETSTTTTTETPPDTTTPRKRTGFYYLVDWNTFLDIDDQKGKRVNLRFQPTIGDPKRFYSVSVP